MYNLAFVHDISTYEYRITRYQLIAIASRPPLYYWEDSFLLFQAETPGPCHCWNNKNTHLFTIKVGSSRGEATFTNVSVHPPDNRYNGLSLFEASVIFHAILLLLKYLMLYVLSIFMYLIFIYFCSVHFHVFDFYSFLTKMQLLQTQHL